MIKILSLSILAFCFIFITGCKKTEITNLWNENSIKIDGDDADWENAPLTISEDINAAFGTANDEKNLYLMLRFSDYRMVRRIQRIGLTVWINSEGKKKKKFGIRYTGSELLAQSLRPQGEFENQMQRSSQFDKMREMMKAHLPGPGMVGVIQNGNVTMEPEKNPWGPSAASAENEGVYCYEFKIPLQFDKSVTDDQVAIAGDKIKVCLEIGGITDEMRNQMKEQMGGMRGGGGGRSGGMEGGRGGMSGGMKGGGMRDGGGRMPGREGFEKQEVWLDVILAKETDQN